MADVVKEYALCSGLLRRGF